MTKLKSVDGGLKNYRPLNIQDILRAEDVKRWTIVNVTRPQSLAEHTFNVIAISRDLCSRLGIGDIQVMKYAFDHDLDEILTGDIPTPAKEMMKIRDCYVGKSREACSALDIAIVKVSDVIEAIRYVNINGLGRHSSQVVDYLVDKLNTKIHLSSIVHPNFERCVGELINDIENGEFTL